MAAQSESPNLKPFRQYNSNDVINLFAHVSGSVNAGTFVIPTVADPDAVPQGFASTSLEGTPARAYSARPSNPWKVRTATSGELPIGVMLNDVRETNNYGERYIYRQDELGALDVVLSGNSVPILTRGIVELNGFSGSPGPNSGAVMHNTVEGKLQVSTSTTNRIGRFLTSSGADGYALFKIEL